jgi:hypothetical protein
VILNDRVREEVELTSPMRRQRESKSSQIILKVLMLVRYCVEWT